MFFVVYQLNIRIHFADILEKSARRCQCAIMMEQL